MEEPWQGRKGERWWAGPYRSQEQVRAVLEGAGEHQQGVPVCRLRHCPGPRRGQAARQVCQLPQAVLDALSTSVIRRAGGKDGNSSRNPVRVACYFSKISWKNSRRFPRKSALSGQMVHASGVLCFISVLATHPLAPSLKKGRRKNVLFLLPF